MADAMAIDSKGNVYVIDEAALKKFGKKVPKERFHLGFNLTRRSKGKADVKGQEWDVCQAGHANCI